MENISENSDFLDRLLALRPRDGQISPGCLSAGEIVGEWRIEAYLGSGLSAEVYRVTSVRMGCEGALKLLTNKERGLGERFRDESDIIRCVSLPALPKFLGTGEHEGMPYFVMEYLQTLEDVFPAGRVPRMMVKIAEAVHSFHEAGFIHRDLKPGNIMCRRNGEIVLIDLGLVKRRGQAGAVQNRRKISMVNGKVLGVGTLEYGAPEQLLKGESTVESDIYALGMILKHFCGDKMGSLRRTFRKATGTDVADRFPTARAFASSIRRRHLPLASCLLLLGGIAIAAAHYPVWKSPLAEMVRAKVNYTQVREEVAVDIAPRENESDFAYFGRIAELAKKGNIEAEVALAEAYFYGRGTETNRVKAVEWYRKAAVAGNSSAQASMGFCAFRGLGCEKDCVAAFDWYSKAAEGGNLGAMNDLAFCYINGFGVDKDPETGFLWAMKAAERGHHPSQTMVAECYLDGIGVEKNIGRAETWLYRAARQGNKRAQALLRTR